MVVAELHAEQRGEPVDVPLAAAVDDLAALASDPHGQLGEPRAEGPVARELLDQVVVGQDLELVVGHAHRDVTTLRRVKKVKASRPVEWRSPTIDSFQPAKGNHATGAATPMFTPSIPASMR